LAGFLARCASRHRASARATRGGASGYNDTTGIGSLDAQRVVPWLDVDAEVKWRTDVVGTFLNDAPIVGLVGALMLGQNVEWQLPAPVHTARRTPDRQR
jgi:hypothetical protein